jgi:hypothetical protein
VFFQIDTSQSGREGDLVKRAFEAITFILALVAIIFAAIQYSDSHELIKSNKALTDRVEYLLGTASTKYIDEFPKDILGIQEVVSGTCENLDIMVSVPGYAQYSSPRDFDRYKAALIAVAKSTIRENKAAKKCLGKKTDPTRNDDESSRIRLLLFRPPDRRIMMADQFQKDRFLAALQDPKSEAKQRFITFFAANPRLIPNTTPDAYLQKVQNGSYDEFLSQLEKLHHLNEVLYCNEGVSIRYSSERFSTYLWLQDNEQAAFSYDTNRITFRTNDQTLIKSFRSLFEDAWKKSTPFDDYKDSPSMATKSSALEQQ